MLKVFGHLNPDTDSVCSAIVYSWFLNQQGKEATPYILGQPNKEALFVLEHCGLEAPAFLGAINSDDEVVIVDTNNPEELPKGIELVKIHEILDHHKLIGGLSSVEPPIVTIRPVACTCTLIWSRMQEENMTTLPDQMATLMLAAILSDTLNLTSPTTTEVDRQVVQKLVEQTGVDTNELSSQMFRAKSDLTGMNARDILLSDSKVFQMGEKKIRVSSLETTDTGPALDMKDELITAAVQLKDEGLDGLFIFIVDILRSDSTLILVSDFEQAIAEQAFSKSAEESLIHLPGVVSRKKQMVPPLEAIIA